MIKIEDLKKQFGETVACDIPTFTINDGDLLGLVGNNGAGKTTLFRMLLDLLKPDEGRVTYQFTQTNAQQLPSLPLGPMGTLATAGAQEGEGLGVGSVINPAESEEWKQYVGAYIDEGFLIDYLTPEEYFAFLAKVSGMPQQLLDERLHTFEHFAGGEVLGQKKLIRNLSAGNKQKVGIMSVLLRQPRLVVLDEPFNFLDPSSQNILKHMLTDYSQQTGATILLSSHNLQHTVDISTRIVLLEKGRILRDIDNSDSAAAGELQDYFDNV